LNRRLRKVTNEIARESRRGAESQSGIIISPESPPAVPGSPESLPTLEEMLELPNREVTPVEEEDLCLAGLFWLPPDPEDHLHPASPSASAPEPRRSKRVLSIAGYYAILAGQSPRKPRK
jgi:hypothetical protein